MIKTYHPQITVKLIKNVSFDTGVAERYKEMRSEIDLTKWLGENGEVTTHKTIDANNPVGTFSIVLADKIDLETQDSVYALIAPMDLIEIRMARESYKYNGELAIVMRGFVTEIKRSESMSDDGKPSRSIVITGMDYAKVFFNLQILLYSYASIGALKGPNRFNFALLFGEAKVVVSVNEFFLQIFDKIISPYLRSLFDGVSPDGFGLNALFSVNEGNIMIDGIDPDHQSTWNLMTAHADLPWNELFIEDLEFGSILTHRKKPYKDPYTGNYILDNIAAEETTIDAIDIKAMDVTRSEANVTNTVWVESPYLLIMKSLHNRAFATQAEGETVYFQNHPNSDPKLYGDRLMQTSTQLSGGVATTRNLPEAKKQKAEADVYGWIRKRRIELFNLNKDNVVFESGTMTLKGNEKIRPGMYLVVNRGNLTAEYYIKSVTQKFLPFRAFTTEVEFIRGTGFVERTQSGQGVYMSEVGRSV